MGIIYWVACRDCKVKRDLDKLPLINVATRKEALDFAEILKENHSFRLTLLATFMHEHQGHNCTMFNDYDDTAAFEDYKEEDFWMKI